MPKSTSNESLEKTLKSSYTKSYDQCVEYKQKPTSLHSLVDDCLMHIFQYLRMRDLAAIGETCQRFHNLANVVYRQVFGTDFVMHYHVGARILRVFSSQIHTIRIVSHTYRDRDSQCRTFCRNDVRQKVQLVHRYCKHLVQPITANLLVHYYDLDKPLTATERAHINEMESRPRLMAMMERHDLLVEEVQRTVKLEIASTVNTENDELASIMNGMKLPASISDLTDDNLMLIFEKLTIEELTNCAGTCIRFTAIAQHIFQKKFTTNFLMHNTVCTRILRIFGQQIIDMTIVGAQYINNACSKNEQYEMLRLVHRYCTNLQILRMDHIYVELFVESSFCKLLRRLSTIRFTIQNYRRPNAYIDGCIKNALEYCDNVKMLNISFVRNSEKMALDPILMVQYPKLHTFTTWGIISSKHVFSWFCRMHRNIKVLNLTLEDDGDNNIDFSDILRLKALHKLWISGDFSRSNAGFCSFINKLHRMFELRYLHLWGPATETQLKAFVRLKLEHLLYLQMPGLQVIINDTHNWHSRLLMIAKNMPSLVEFRMTDFDWTRNSHRSLGKVFLGLVAFSQASVCLQRLGTTGGLLVNDNDYMKFVKVIREALHDRRLSIFGFGVNVSANLLNEYKHIVNVKSTDIKFVHTGFD